MKTNICLKLFSYLFLPAISFLIVDILYAAESDTVTATVTAEVISVSLNQESIPFGVVATSDTQDTTSNGLGISPDYTITATNNGSVIEDFHVQASDTSDWDLADSAGIDFYTMKYCTATCDSTPSWAGVGKQTTSTYVKFADDIAVSSTQDMDMQIGTPTSTAIVTQQSSTITVMATAVDGTP